jgi:HEPN domain-containing protein
VPTTNEDFKALAARRIREAEILYAGYEFAGAYYLAGYAIECALKACIAKQTRAGDFPPPADEVRRGYYTHDLTALLKSAGLLKVKNEKCAADKEFNLYWGVVEKWNEGARYEVLRTGPDAHNIIVAVGDSTSGVLTWIRGYW